MERLERLFQQEKWALRDEGEQFSEDFPESARFLGTHGDSELDQDPYVDRLTEGAALLLARVRETLVVEQDGFSRLLLEVVAPGLDRALPSVAVVKFPLRSDFSSPGRLERGTSVVGAKGRSGAVFRLCHDVPLEQVAIRSSRIERLESGEDALEIELGKTAQDKSGPWPKRLPMFLFGDAPVVWTLRFGLLRRLRAIRIQVGDSWETLGRISVSRLDQPGYSIEHGEMSPFMGLRDFLCADERFRFLSLDGLDELSHLPRLKLRFVFHGTVPRGVAKSVAAGTIHLHTGVVVNEFLEPCQAVDWDHSSTSQPLRPVGGAHREILDVRSIVGLGAEQSGERIRYRRYSSFRAVSDEGWFQLLESVQAKGRRGWSISLGCPPDRRLDCQSLAVEAVCSDGDHPHEDLQPSHFSRLAMEVPPRVSVMGLTRPTQSYRFPREADSRSMLLAFAAGHFDGWLEANRLKDALRHLAWDPSESKRTLIEAIQEVRIRNDHVLRGGVAWRRMTAIVRLRDTTCTPDTWDRLGVIDAFGSVLFGLVQDSTPIGSRTRLQLVVDPAGIPLEWEN